MRNFRMKAITGLSCLAFVANTSCSSKDDDAAAADTGLAGAKISLETMPDASTMLDTETGDLVADVPLMFALINDPETYFYEGAPAAIIEAGSATEEQRSQMQKGDAVCRQSQSTIGTFNDLVGGTLCYMKNMPKMTESITVEKGSDTVTADDYSAIFAQEAAEKHVAIVLGQGEQSQTAHMVIPGTDTAANSYIVDFYMCRGGSAKEHQVFTINKTDRTYTEVSTNIHDEEGFSGKQSQTIVAYLKATAAGGLTFDSSKNRTISGNRTDTSANFSNTEVFEISIDEDNTVQGLFNRANTSTWNDQTFTGEEKIGSRTMLSGSTLDTFAITDLATTMDRTWGDQNFVEGGAADWQDDAYKVSTTSPLVAWQEAFSFDDYPAIFGQAPEADEIDHSSLSCETDAADVVVAWDMSSDEFASVNETCSNNNGDQNFWEMCNGDDIRTAFNLMWNPSLR